MERRTDKAVLVEICIREDSLQMLIHTSKLLRGRKEKKNSVIWQKSAWSWQSGYVARPEKGGKSPIITIIQNLIQIQKKKTLRNDWFSSLP